MNTIKKSLFAFFLSFAYLAQAQLSTDYPFLRKVFLQSKVNYESSSQIYYYDYTLINDISSRGDVVSFWLDISRTKNSVSLDTAGLLFADNEYVEWSFRERFPKKQEEIIPVGYYKLPENCDATLGNPPTACFGIVASRVNPGQSLKGFIMMSRGLPTVRWFIAFPSFNIYEFFPNIEDTTATMSIEQMDSIREVVNYHGITIGPTAPPIDFIPTAWLDTLLSYTRQSVMLGWLKSGRDNDCDGDEKPQDGVSKNLEKRLNKVRTELAKGNNLKASKELEKFIKKIERVSKRTDVMTSEAYALLKYNAEYLVRRIITLPTKPAGTVLQQIDELKAELARQSNKKKIGGVLLVKSLTFLADQAKKQLQKPLPSTNDSASAALSIAAFQLFVDEVWELTGALSGKSKKLPALYVYDEAYIQLHYRAKYILESLPAPRTLIDMKSVEMDDETRKELDAMRQMTEEQ